MYSIFPFILVIISLAIIIFVVVKKLPQLTLLDVDSIPEIKIEKKKGEIYKKRLEKSTAEAGKKTTQMFFPLVRKWKELQLAFRIYVGKIEREVMKRLHEKKDKTISTDAPQTFKVLLQEGEYSLDQGDLDNAEKKFISAIRLDAKNTEAYYGLGIVYQRQNHLAEARETFKFVLQLKPGDVKVLDKLAEIEELEKNWEQAVRYYEQSVLLDDGNSARFAKIADLLQTLDKNETALEAIKQALELEPQNPKYLDKAVEIGVLCGNKKMADDAYQRLRMVNPENQKLLTLREKINQLSS